MEFRDVEFMSAKDKALVLKQWDRFVRSGFERKYFTKRVYDHLSLHCSFIAHYNIDGFYQTYFVEKRNTWKFIDQFTTGISAEYGMNYWMGGDYDDINPAMCDVMKKYAPDLRRFLDSAIEDEDLEIAQALLAKHGKKFVIEDL
jgi:hypothetical protein